MNFYAVVLFAHILGMLGLFIAISLQWTSILRLRQAQTIAQVREWMSLTVALRKIPLTATLLILVTGLYMTVTEWSWRIPWIDISLALLIFGSILGMRVNSRRLKAIHRAAAVVETPTEAIPAELQSQINDPILWTSVHMISAMTLGAVFLMTTKPNLVGSLITLAVVLILGIISAQLWQSPRQATVPVTKASE
jgi:hypothetical protein